MYRMTAGLDAFLGDEAGFVVVCSKCYTVLLIGHQLNAWTDVSVLPTTVVYTGLLLSACLACRLVSCLGRVLFVSCGTTAGQ